MYNIIDFYNCYESLKFLLFVPQLLHYVSCSLSLSDSLFNFLCTCLSCYKRLFLCMTFCSSLCIARLFVRVKIVLAEVLLILLNIIKFQLAMVK